MIAILLGLGLLAALVAFTVSVKAAFVPLKLFEVEAEEQSSPIPAPHVLRKPQTVTVSRRSNR